MQKALQNPFIVRTSVHPNFQCAFSFFHYFTLSFVEIKKYIYLDMKIAKTVFFICHIEMYYFCLRNVHDLKIQ